MLARIPPPICYDQSETLSFARGLVNDTTEPVHIFTLVDGHEELVMTVPVGDATGWVFPYITSGSHRGTATDLVIRDDAGAEIGRIPPPLWFIEPVFVSDVKSGGATTSPAP